VSSILIIGAGAAGLAAARDLSHAGREVIVLEARDRIGGRIFTHKDPQSPIPIELGAEFVHGKSPELWHIARAAHLQLYEVTERHWYFENDKLSKSRDFWKKIESLMDEMKSSETDRSFKEFLASLPDDEETRRAKAMAVRYVEGFHAANIERIGVHGLIKANEASDEIDGDKSFRFLNGYDSLVQAVRAEAENYGAMIHLNTYVREIHRRDDKVEVLCEGTGTADSLSASTQGVRFNASAAIITLPLGVLQANQDGRDGVRFIPDLPEKTQAAIKQLVMGNVLKVTLRFHERFWESLKRWDEDSDTANFAGAAFFHCPDAPFPTWWTQLPLRAPILVGWVGGPGAEGSRQKAVGSERGSSPTVREGASVRGTSPTVREGSVRGGSTQTSAGSEANMTQDFDSLILNQAITSLARIFNISTDDVCDQLAASYIHDWQRDPFSRGAYSYVPVNGLAAQRVLSEPIDNTLFFAGEANSIGHIGTVHGAIHSGQRAAKEILTLSRK